MRFERGLTLRSNVSVAISLRLWDGLSLTRRILSAVIEMRCSQFRCGTLTASGLPGLTSILSLLGGDFFGHSLTVPS